MENNTHPWSVKFAYEGMSKAEVEIFASSLLFGSRLSSFSISSRLGMARMAAVETERHYRRLEYIPKTNALSRALAAAPVALEKKEEAAEATCGAGAGAGEALTAARREIAATRIVEDIMLCDDQEDEEDEEDEEDGHEFEAFLYTTVLERNDDKAVIEIKTRSGYAPHLSSPSQ
jgi:hypothetical protein